LPRRFAHGQEILYRTSALLSSVFLRFAKNIFAVIPS
jgi:hypothetical protein